jgi:WhiB family redox-sensing transcriptional regulator
VNEALLQWLMSAPNGPDDQLTLEDFLQRPAWQRNAACAGGGVKAFFAGASADIDHARAVCHTCPVQAACLQYPLGDDTLAGVLAGTTERERRELRRARVA